MASLVVQTSFLGDVVLTTPLIAELAKRDDVDVLTTLPGARILANNPAIRNTLVYEKRDNDTGLSGFIRIVRKLRQTGSQKSATVTGDQPGRSEPSYDIAYMAQGSMRSAMVAFAAGAKHRVGFDTAAGSPLYTEKVRYDPDRHHAERLWWLSMSDCADPPLPEQIRPRLYPGDDECRMVDKALTESGVNAPFVVLAPGSAWGTKRWPFYPELAALLSDHFQVVVVGGNSELAVGDMIVADLAPDRAVNVAGKLSLLGSAELISRAAAIVSNDSVGQHLASAVGTPTVTVYGPTTPKFGFGPLAPHSATAGLTDLACRPCHRHGPARCPLGHWRCMRELSSQQVYEIFMSTLPRQATA